MPVAAANPVLIIVKRVAAREVGAEGSDGHQRATGAGRELPRIGREIGGEARVRRRHEVEQRRGWRSGDGEHGEPGRQHRPGHGPGRHVRGRRLEERQVGVAVRRVEVEFVMLREFPVELAEGLIAVLLLLEVIPDRVLPAAAGPGQQGRRIRGLGRRELAAERGASEVEPSGADAKERQTRRGRRDEGFGVAAARPPALRVLIVGPVGEVLAQHRQLRAVLVAARDQRVPVFTDLSPGEVGRVVAALGSVDPAIVATDLQALEGALGDEIHHPADGIRTVGGRGAVLQHLHAANGRERQHVGVRRERERQRQAVAVEQRQRPLRSQPPKVDGGGAILTLTPSAGDELVRLADHPGGLRQLLDEFDDGRRALPPQHLLRHHVDRQRGGLRRSEYVRAGDDNFTDFGRRGWRCVRGGRLRRAQGHYDGQRRAGAEVPTVHVFLPNPEPRLCGRR